MGRSSRYQLAQVLAFIALVVAAVVWLLVGVGVDYWILPLVRDICVLGAIALSAYGFAKSAGKLWFIIYWIIIIVAIVGLVFGATGIFL